MHVSRISLRLRPIGADVPKTVDRYMDGRIAATMPLDPIDNGFGPMGAGGFDPMRTGESIGSVVLYGRTQTVDLVQ